MSRAHEHLKKQEFPQAYEFLLASLRLDPSDPAVFAAVADFINATAKHPEPKVEDLAQDLYRRADLLVTYQPLDSLIAARNQYLKLGEQFPNAGTARGSSASDTASPSDPFAEIQKSIERAKDTKDTSVPLAVRTRILEHARNELNALAEQAAMKEMEPLPADFWKRFSAIEGSVEKAETAVLEGLFSERRKAIEGWITGPCAKALESARSPEVKDVPSVSDRLSEEIQAGIRHQSALAPFAESGISGARELQLKVQETVDLLDRTKDWLYNQQAIRRIEYAKQSHEMSSMDKLKYLVVIREERLVPYIAKQFNDVWEIAFNDCKTEKDKLEALKLRGTRRNTP